MEQNPQLNDIFAKRLKQLRREKNITQERLAFILDVKRTAIANWECGTRMPSYIKIRDLSEYFDVSADYLCGRTDGKNQVVATSMSGLDLSMLNFEGLKLLSEFYRFLISDSKYRAN
jgi:transcriptional regulator with XRE-family HTH domain